MICPLAVRSTKAKYLLALGAGAGGWRVLVLVHPVYATIALAPVGGAASGGRVPGGGWAARVAL
jgi:hypothetical protein